MSATSSRSRTPSLDEGVKVGHLTYLGDAHVGEHTNIGAGTVTCNYDGVMKHRTEIGAHAFIGSDTMLVAPVTVGAGAMTASGSVITEDVPARGAGARARAAGQQARPRHEADGPVARPQGREGKELMCGIVGVLGNHEVAPLLVEALKRLEYRGYDSAGIATVNNGRLDRRRAVGKLVNLSDLLVHEPARGQGGHRPHPLGHAWRGHRRQCPSAQRRAGRGRPQRHHRELPRPAGRT